MSRLRRFLHLELPRAKEPDAATAPAPDTAHRFGTVERPVTRQAPAAGSGAELGRFGPEPDRAARRSRADAELAAARRAMGEELARAVGEHERRRLGMDGRGSLLAWLRDLVRVRRR